MIAPFITFILGILATFLFDRFYLFFHRKRKSETFRDESPQVMLHSAEKLLSPDILIRDSTSYIVSLNVVQSFDGSGNQIEKAQLAFEKISTGESIEDLSHKSLLVVYNAKEFVSKILALEYSRYGILSTIRLSDDMLKKECPLTLIFENQSRPDKLHISFHEAKLIYNTTEITGAILKPSQVIR